MLASSSLICAAGISNSVAQEEEGEGAIPVETYACKYNEGMGPADLDAAVAKWNAWADDHGLNDYSAWTLTKFYYGPDQEFDVLWLGVSQTSQGMGAAQDDYLASGTSIAAEFEKALTCDGHGQFAALNFKEPPDTEDPPSSVFISFSDCNIADGKDFGDDIAPAISAWADFRTEQGSAAGHWIFFPVYGGGGEEFDFKYVTGHRTLEAQGIDWDNYDPDKISEIFADMLDCDSTRVYLAQNRRRAADAKE